MGVGDGQGLDDSGQLAELGSDPVALTGEERRLRTRASSTIRRACARSSSASRAGIGDERGGSRSRARRSSSSATRCIRSTSSATCSRRTRAHRARPRRGATGRARRRGPPASSASWRMRCGVTHRRRLAGVVGLGAGPPSSVVGGLDGLVVAVGLHVRVAGARWPSASPEPSATLADARAGHGVRRHRRRGAPTCRMPVGLEVGGGRAATGRSAGSRWSARQQPRAGAGPRPRRSATQLGGPGAGRRPAVCLSLARGSVVGVGVRGRAGLAGPRGLDLLAQASACVRASASAPAARRSPGPRPRTCGSRPGRGSRSPAGRRGRWAPATRASASCRASSRTASASASTVACVLAGAVVTCSAAVALGLGDDLVAVRSGRLCMRTRACSPASVTTCWASAELSSSTVRACVAGRRVASACSSSASARRACAARSVCGPAPPPRPARLQLLGDLLGVAEHSRGARALRRWPEGRLRPDRPASRSWGDPATTTGAAGAARPGNRTAGAVRRPPVSATGCRKRKAAARAGRGCATG